MNDPFNLERFVEAQDPVYADVVAELKSGRKTGHWMWFVFPQLKGLGSSPMSQRFAISSLDEARAYLLHPVLGPRLVECVRLVLAIPHSDIHRIFGYPDDLKFHSSLTLFAEADSTKLIFKEALKKYFDGR